ncbi:hypothetical protein L3Q67_02625 [Saccharothrix sp. AJ9571]|nr:hypothetical protein L3Q67_02625 [Saccharothrix sp. AJ9571]
MNDVVEQRDILAACRAFITRAFDVLRDDHVIPPSTYQPYITAGHDYAGPDIMALAEYKALEALLDETYPERFAEPLKRRHSEFASQYIFTLLEACVARCARVDRFDLDAPGIDESISELLTVLGTTTIEIVTTRHVSHLTTTSGEEVEVSGITVVPEQDGVFGQFTGRIQREINGASRAWDREVPHVYDPPHALLITRETTDEPDHNAVDVRLSERLERFLFLARLVTAGTVQSGYEVTGTTTLVTRVTPRMRTFGKGILGSATVRRTVRLTGHEGDAFTALGNMIDAADVKRDKMAATSFDVALTKFNHSHRTASPYEHLVDLATALEAVFIGEGDPKDEVTLRLRTRVATLLATDTDPATALFDDVGHLYKLRSLLVHGGQISLNKLRGAISGISTVPGQEVEHAFGVAVDRAVDRMRDLVRRAILARLCLAAEPDPLWPFTSKSTIDAVFTDDAQRVAWRARWRSRLAELGIEYAADRARAAADFLSQDDR